jgi:hypothetical protein
MQSISLIITYILFPKVLYTRSLESAITQLYLALQLNIDYLPRHLPDNTIR